MVIDKIENYSLYVTLTERMAKGFEFINNTIWLHGAGSI
jgi:hypothetical protein